MSLIEAVVAGVVGCPFLGPMELMWDRRFPTVAIMVMGRCPSYFDRTSTRWV
jgi:hypothetical protein